MSLSNVDFHWLTSRFTFLAALAFWCTILYFWRNKCIRMGLTELKIVIWGGKSSVLWLQITFFSSRAISCSILQHQVSFMLSVNEVECLAVEENQCSSEILFETMAVILVVLKLVCLEVLRLSTLLRSCQAGQLTYPHCSWAGFQSSIQVISAHTYPSNW